MTTKEKYKAFVEENAKYKVGQTVYRVMDDRPCKAKITSVDLGLNKNEFWYEYGDYRGLGSDSVIYSSVEDLRAAIVAEYEAEVAKWRAMTEDDVKDLDETDLHCDRGQGR